MVRFNLYKDFYTCAGYRHISILQMKDGHLQPQQIQRCLNSYPSHVINNREDWYQGAFEQVERYYEMKLLRK